MPQELIYTRAHLVLPTEVLAHATLVVRDGHIAAIDASPSQVPGAIDCRSDYLLPGLVEVHTDNLERHVMPRPRVSFPMRSALQAHDAELAGCGITTVFDAVGVGDPYDDGFRAQDQSALLQALDELDNAGLLRARHYIHARCELPAPNARALFEPFAHHARLRLISLMDHTPGQRQWTDTEHARVFYTGRKGWSDARFAHELTLAPERQARFAEPQRRWFADFARTHGIALATHDDTTPEHVDEALALGARMSEFPTTLAAAQRARHLGLTTIAGAPNVVRGGSHSGNVSALQLAQAGVLDGLSSDYVPGSLLQAAWHLHHEGGFSLPEAVAVVTRGPALAAGMNDRGELAIGQLGDLVQVHELTGRPVLRSAWRGAMRIA